MGRGSFCFVLLLLLFTFKLRGKMNVFFKAERFFKKKLGTPLLTRRQKCQRPQILSAPYNRPFSCQCPKGALELTLGATAFDVDCGGWLLSKFFSIPAYFTSTFYQLWWKKFENPWFKGTLTNNFSRGSVKNAEIPLGFRIEKKVEEHCSRCLRPTPTNCCRIFSNIVLAELRDQWATFFLPQLPGTWPHSAWSVVWVLRYA